MISYEEAVKYAKIATLIPVIVMALAITVSYLSAMAFNVQQNWLVNLHNTCGKHFETDA